MGRALVHEIYENLFEFLKALLAVAISDSDAVNVPQT